MPVSDCGHDHSKDPLHLRHTHSHAHGQRAEWVDRMGIWFSFICLIHCALTPVILAFVPAMLWGGDGTHMVLAFVLPILAMAAFIPGFRRHSDWFVIAMGVTGLAMIILALWAPSTVAEVAMTMNGSLLLIAAHWRNRKLKSKPDKSQKTQAYG